MSDIVANDGWGAVATIWNWKIEFQSSSGSVEEESEWFKIERPLLDGELWLVIARECSDDLFMEALILRNKDTPRR